MDTNAKHNTIFATRLKEVLDYDVKITQRELGEAIGKTRQTVSQYCNGTSEPPYETLVRIAKYLGVTTDYLLGATDDSGMTPVATDDLSLDYPSIRFIQLLQREFSNGRSIDLNFLLANGTVWAFVNQMLNYIAAHAAVEISAELYNETHSRADSHSNTTVDYRAEDAAYADAVNSLVEGNVINAQTAQYLSLIANRKLHVWNDSPVVFTSVGDIDVFNKERLRLYDAFRDLMGTLDGMGVRRNVTVGARCESSRFAKPISDTEIIRRIMDTEQEELNRIHCASTSSVDD